MVRDGATDEPIREGEPPYCSEPDPEASLTEKVIPSGAVRLMMAILVWCLRAAALLIAGWAGLGAFVAWTFRFDAADEFEMVKQFDVDAGGALALAVVLFFIPSRIKKPLQCFLILAIAALVWLFVSWNLLAHHEWVDRVRSGF